MNLHDFKTWFDGFAAVVGTGGLTSQQFAALKEAVKDLGSEPVKQEADKEPGPVPAQSPVPMPLSKEQIQKILDGLNTPHDKYRERPTIDPLGRLGQHPPIHWLEDSAPHFAPGTILFSTRH